MCALFARSEKVKAKSAQRFLGRWTEHILRTLRRSGPLYGNGALSNRSNFPLDNPFSRRMWDDDRRGNRKNDKQNSSTEFTRNSTVLPTSQLGLLIALI